MALQDVGCSMDWTELTEEEKHVAGSCECGNLPPGSICGEFFD
jgi:hypothetical protein